MAEPASPGAAAAEEYGGPRPTPPVPPPIEPSADAPLSAVLDATRALLWIESPTAVAEIARDLVEALGGRVVPAPDATEDALPVDVSFSVGQPLLPPQRRREWPGCCSNAISRPSCATPSGR